MNVGDLMPGEFLRLELEPWGGFLGDRDGKPTYTFVRFRGLFGDEAVTEDANGKRALVGISRLLSLDAQVPS